MVEYALILVLIGLVGIVVMNAAGSSQKAFSNVSGSLDIGGAGGSDTSLGSGSQEARP